jgi:hypothetical protein
MIKKRGALILTALILSSFLIANVSAVNPVEGFSEQVSQFMGIWEDGRIDPGSTVLKWLALFLVTILIYSSLSYGEFPEHTGLRWLISIIVGFLATMLITTPEMVAAMQSYKALGITFIIFLPILILTFFTFVVATKVNPLGIVVQRIAWVIYSVYLFLQTGLLLIIKWAYDTPSTAIKLGKGETWDNIFSFLYGHSYADRFIDSGGADTTITIILFVVSIAVFIIFVVYNRAMTAWLAKEKREADINKYKDTSERSKKSREVDADLTR